jgi:hypothetical protein
MAPSRPRVPQCCRREVYQHTRSPNVVLDADSKSSAPVRKHSIAELACLCVKNGQLELQLGRRLIHIVHQKQLLLVCMHLTRQKIDLLHRDTVCEA